MDFSSCGVVVFLHILGTSKPPSKPYCVSNGGKLRRDNSPVGGYFRDYSAHVDLRFSKVSFTGRLVLLP